jgi:hypothetical protein
MTSLISRVRMPLGSMPEVSPIFVVGMGRSGTTPLQLALNMHPQLAMFGETQAFLERRRYATLQRPGNLEQFVAEWRMVLRDSSPDTTLLQEREFKLRLAQCGSYAAALNEVMSALASRQGKSAWGEKTPAHIFTLDSIFRCFPNARILHIIRDPRGAVSSSIRFLQRDFTDWNVYAGAHYWLRCIHVHDSQVRNRNPRYCSLRYEDLIKNGEQTFRDVCAFLRIDFWPEMLQFHLSAKNHVPKDANGRIVQHHSRTQLPLDSSRAEAWQKELTAHQVGIIERYTGQKMIENGYSLSGGRGRHTTGRGWDSAGFRARWATAECQRWVIKLGMDSYWVARHLFADRTREPIETFRAT